MPFCTTCGTANDEGDRFCSSCGGTISIPHEKTSVKSLGVAGLSIGSKIASVGAILGLLLFFLPWIDVFGSARFSGLQIALQHKPSSLLFLLIPITFGGVLWLDYQCITGVWEKKSAGIAYVVSGALALLLQLWLYAATSKEVGQGAGNLFTSWFWISTFSYLAMIAGSMMDRVGSEQGIAP
jgi:hypothetical protein